MINAIFIFLGLGLISVLAISIIRARRMNVFSLLSLICLAIFFAVLLLLEISFNFSQQSQLTLVTILFPVFPISLLGVIIFGFLGARQPKGIQSSAWIAFLPVGVAIAIILFLFFSIMRLTSGG